MSIKYIKSNKYFYYILGHRVEEQWVFGGIKEDSRRNCRVVVPCRNRETLLSIILRYILAGSIIISDCWKAYDILGKKKD